MAAKVAASVVWFTMGAFEVLISGLSCTFSTFTGSLEGFIAISESIFLIVTEAFDCTGTGFAEDCGRAFAFCGVFASSVVGLALADTLIADLLGNFAALTTGSTTFALLAGLATATFFTVAVETAFVVTFDDLGFAGAVFFVESTWVFAVFFITLAMESTTKKVVFSHIMTKPALVRQAFHSVHVATTHIKKLWANYQSKIADTGL